MQQIWHNGEGLTEDAFVIENICVCLRRLAELFKDDQRGPTPHSCISFAATSRVLVTVARISAAFRVDSIAKEALSICQLLIDSEEEAFLADKGFVDTLPDFVESIQQLGTQKRDDEIEATLVEVLFGITAKLRVEPHLLRAWFRPEKPEDDGEDLTIEERRTQWEEFPLLYIILHYVPFEGRTGEFSRMGLVYIVEMATVSSDLEKWLVEGDMAALMASGIGALYSQLSRYLYTMQQLVMAKEISGNLYFVTTQEKHHRYWYFPNSKQLHRVSVLSPQFQIPIRVIWLLSYRHSNSGKT